MKIFFIFLILAGSLCECKHADEIYPRLWYDKPADATVADSENGWQSDPEWLKALPVGNGFLGAMVFGDVNKERIQLNEKSLWSGSPDENDNPDAFASLNKIRQLLFAGKYREATELTLKTQVCKGAGSGFGNGASVPYGCYQTLGDLWLDFDTSSDYENYHRELDLENGIVKVSYRQDGVEYHREIFASYPDRAIVMKINAGKKGKLHFITSLTRPERFEVIPQDDHLLMKGTLNSGKGGEGMKYAARIKVTGEGKISVTGDSIVFSEGTVATIILTASTNYKQEYPGFEGDDPEKTSLAQLNNAAEKSYNELLDRHIQDYRSSFDKAALKLSYNNTDTIPTDSRLKDTDDPRLHEIYFAYGRYLLISSSREGSLPANLQGLWANKIQTPWNCDYHTNINVQMNYWPADMTNLEECHEPLVKFIESLVEPGQNTARVQYHADGWCVHPITNVWGFTAPGEHPSWGLHLGAGGWLCQHLWDHYAFTLDTAYLERVWPVMLGAAQFYLDWLVEDPVSGKLVSGPASSPENTFIAPDGSRAQISMGPSHDQEVIHELFTNVLEASEILDKNNPLTLSIDSALDRLALPGIGSDGRLMEWREEFPEAEPTHRHVSHLYMLHPGNMINPATTPELAEAAQKSLEARTDLGTGWSLAWKVNFWARLHDGERAYRLLKNVLRPVEALGTNMSDAGGSYQNLFCAHPPFQIDGNFGATSGIAEMLVQSHIQDGDTWMIQLLTALPAAWPKGEVRGLKAHGGFEVSMSWDEGKLQSCEIKSLKGSNLHVTYNNEKFTCETQKNGVIRLNENLEKLN